MPVGRGLVAKTGYRSGDTIVCFTGNILTTQEFESRWSPDSKQRLNALHLDDDAILDCNKTVGNSTDYSPQCLASCAREVSGVHTMDGKTPKANAELKAYKRRVFLRALGEIKAGDEVIYKYFNRYKAGSVPEKGADNYNTFLKAAEAAGHRGQLNITVTEAGYTLEVDMALSQILKALRSQHTDEYLTLSTEELVESLLPDLVCKFSRIITPQEYDGLGNDYNLTEIHGFCQLQTVSCLHNKDLQLFSNWNIATQGSRATHYRSFMEATTPQFRAIIAELNDTELASSLLHSWQVYEKEVSEAVGHRSNYIPKLTANDFPLIELGLCVALAWELPTAIFVVDQSSMTAPTRIPLTGMSDFPEKRDAYRLSELSFLPECAMVASTGPHIHPIKCIAPIPADTFERLAAKLRGPLLEYLRQIGFETPVHKGPLSSHSSSRREGAPSQKGATPTR
jgi:hypothetical protein